MGCSSGPDIIQDGLVLCLDAASIRSYPKSGTTWSDLAGANDGTLNNGPIFSSDNGGSIEFDGSDDSVSIVDSQSVRVSEGTLSVWVYPNSFPSTNYTHIVFKKLTVSPFSSFGIWVKHNTNTIYGGFGGAGHESAGTSAIPTNTWSNLVITYDGQYRKMYFNSILDAQVSDVGVTISYDSNPVQLGFGDYNNELDGKISLASLYNRALTADEVRQNYLSTKERFA